MDKYGYRIIGRHIASLGKNDVDDKEPNRLLHSFAPRNGSKTSPRPLRERVRVRGKIAFTLAEVLITLGIIGVLAALTLPTVIAKCQNKILENQYKKVVSHISQAILLTKNENGLENFRQYCINESYKTDNLNYELMGVCNGYLKKYIHGKIIKNISRTNEDIKTYNSKQKVTPSHLVGIGSPLYQTKALPDGSFVNHQIIEAEFYIVVDINGHKKPNKLGHDIFAFKLDNKDFLTSIGKPQELTDEQIKNDEFDNIYGSQRAGNPCSLTSTQGGNGIGCSYYVLRDECPYDSSKKYFECLPK